MKDYKKILESIVNIINTTEKSDIGFAKICTYIGENCPELKESESERIKKAIIAVFKGQIAFTTEEDCKKYIAWLEKQGEQKPAWSEEDERNLEFVISQLKIIIDEKHFAPVIDWLKSIRPQSQWKPSDKHIIAVNTAINVLGKGTLSGKQLIELQEQLKRLKN